MTAVCRGRDMKEQVTYPEESIARLQIEYWPLDRLIPYARNARTHSQAQIAEIAGSIAPLVTWSGLL